MTDEPAIRPSIAADLRRLGLGAGDAVLVHSSLRSLGWVCGGAVTVVQALLDTVGPDGTVVVPTQTMGNSDPRHWTNPPVPESWWPVIREHMPAFDPAITPSGGVGVIPEVVRTWPGAVRSAHPHTSFAALGSAAGTLMAGHRLDCQLGEESPLAALERVDGKVLLLGVGYDRCTAFHLAEYRVRHPALFEFSAAVHTPSGRSWVTYIDVATSSDDFADLGAAFDPTSAVRRGRVGAADCRLFSVREAVAFATTWLPHHRGTA
ncbi:AAC(3) family N-acetyltransferase [Actinophytocola sp.]|uniref:aminoglycoside N(3)-acetyltransferase n=1 Tax=Actinophytocola sp. TaxID=1872138 RepID=UPI002D80A2B9|nr:AAC(3) family N-acetyltransferase [Actinophytocola sp.]HET9141375.1 AAC(3) family N-acetyltransferase [Actinophytocola sp.]